MTTLTRWNPFKEMDDMQERLSSWFGHPLAKTASGEETLKVAEWAPLVDITEDEKEYLVKTELPEIKKEDVKITVEDGVLNISGERKLEKEEKNRKYHRVERAYGSFVRRFTLPEDSDSAKVSAEFKEGMLKVHLPKSLEKKAKGGIDIKVN